MKISSKIHNRRKNQKQLFADYEELIAMNNLRFLQASLLSTAIIFFVMFFMSFIIPGCRDFWYIYLLIAAFSLLLHQLFRLPELLLYSVPALYIFAALLFIYTAFISLSVHPDQMASALIGVFCLVPVCILDRSWRVNTIVLLFYLIHTVLAFLYKTPAIATDDMMNVACFTAGGIFAGEYMRYLRLNNISLIQKEESMNDLDFLTGLQNRRKLLTLDTVPDCNDIVPPVTGIILLDIDHFQLYNESFGQPAGDNCIQTIGHFLKDFGENYQLEICRYGGDEFIVAITYPIDYDLLQTLATDLCRQIMNLKIDFPQSPLGCISVGAGFIHADSEHPDRIEKLINKAYVALREAKKSGENHVGSLS